MLLHEKQYGEYILDVQLGTDILLALLLQVQNHILVSQQQQIAGVHNVVGEFHRTTCIISITHNKSTAT